MKKSYLAFAVLLSFPVLAQQASTTRTADGAIDLKRSGIASGSTAPAGAPPLVIVSGKRQLGTDWIAPQSGELTVGTSSGDRTVKLNPKGADVDLSRGAATSAPTVIRRGAASRWSSRSRACPAHYTGAVTWQVEEIQTVTNPAWTETGQIRNYAENCTAVVDTRWIAQSSSCPSGHSGSNTWEVEERSIGGGAWTATGATRNHNNTCKAPPPPENPSPGPGCTKGQTYTFVSQPNQFIVYPPATCNASNRGQHARLTYWIQPQYWFAPNFSYGQYCGGGAPGPVPLSGAAFVCTSNGWRPTVRSTNCKGDNNYMPPMEYVNQDVNYLAMLETFQAEVDARDAGYPGMPAGANTVVSYSCLRIVTE
jgi:hypothetical protein